MKGFFICPHCERERHYEIEANKYGKFVCFCEDCKQYFTPRPQSPYGDVGDFGRD